MTADLLPLADEPIKAALAVLLTQQRDEEGDLPTAAGTTLRGSYAMKCSRQVAFDILGLDKDYEPDSGALANFEVGHQWHAVIQNALVQSHGAELEVEIDLRPEWDMSTHADAIYDGTAVEIKSKAEYAYKLYAEGMKGSWAKHKTEPVGPEQADIIQATFSALGAGCDSVHLIYVNKNKPAEMAEWRFSIDAPLPHLNGATARNLALLDLDRLSQVARQVESGMLPERLIPGHGVVARPPAHHSQGGKGQPWRCRYCAFRDRCADQPAGVVPLDAEVVA